MHSWALTTLKSPEEAGKCSHSEIGRFVEQNLLGDSPTIGKHFQPCPLDTRRPTARAWHRRLRVRDDRRRAVLGDLAGALLSLRPVRDAHVGVGSGAGGGDGGIGAGGNGHGPKQVPRSVRAVPGDLAGALAAVQCMAHTLAWGRWGATVGAGA